MRRGEGHVVAEGSGRGCSAAGPSALTPQKPASVRHRHGCYEALGPATREGSQQLLSTKREEFRNCRTI